uniref:Uncharacterized protein n=1 Tax=Brugia timori TaxID=42155 RepID=A0A0R3R9A9_9BILA
MVVKKVVVVPEGDLNGNELTSSTDSERNTAPLCFIFINIFAAISS